MRRLVIVIPRPWWLSSNDRLHRMEVARRTSSIRMLAKHAARGLSPIPYPCTVTAIIGYSTARKADAPNAWPSVKAAIDGVVDAGVLPDDNTEIVPRHVFARDPEKSRPGSYRITLLFDQEVTLCAAS